MRVWCSLFILLWIADLADISGQYSVFTAFLDAGDEVILFEPFFDQYLPSVVFNGGKCVYVPLHPPSQSNAKPTADDWTINHEELRCGSKQSQII